MIKEQEVDTATNGLPTSASSERQEQGKRWGSTKPAERGRQRQSKQPKASNPKQPTNTSTKPSGKRRGAAKKKAPSRRAAQQASPLLAMAQSSSSQPGGSNKAPDNHSRDDSPPPSIYHCNGSKVTLVDEELMVFVVDLVPEETCNLIRKMIDDHVNQQVALGAPAWRTLYTYTKMDLPCSEIEGFGEKVLDQMMADIVKIVGEMFGQRQEAAKLRPRSWKEPHALLYQKVDGKPHHTGVEMHYDGCDITWQIMLTRMDEYTGGGTYIRCLRKTIKLEQGQVLVHPGELYHKGVDITSGVRCLIVSFMDGFDPKIVDASKQTDDKEEYEKNVRSY